MGATPPRVALDLAAPRHKVELVRNRGQALGRAGEIMNNAQPQVDPRRIFVRSYLVVARREYVPKNSFDAFFPFVVAAADPRDGLVYDPYAIAGSLKGLGWAVGGDFVGLFTEGLTQRGLLTPEDNNKVRRWTAASVRPDDGQTDDAIEHLKQSFFDFTESMSGLLLHNVSADQRLNDFATSLATNRLFSMSALQQYAERELTEPVDYSEKSGGISLQDFDYLCARFINHAHKNDEKSFNALLVLANIGVVTQLTNFFHNRTDTLEKTGSPILVLDGPFLIDYAGFNGEVRRADAALIVEAARQRGSKIWAFKHSVNEARDIVKAVVLSDPRERFGPLAVALRNGSVTVEILNGFLEDAFGMIGRLGIIDSFFDIKGNHRWEEEDFNDADWQAVYAKLAGWNEIARRRDCDSILGIMRQRRGAATSNPWDSQLFLLTSNAVLATLVKKACVEQGILQADKVGPAISRNEFAAILWLAGDQNNKTEVVATHLLAAAQGMLARDKGMIDKVKEYTENLEVNRRELVDAIVQTELSYELLQDITLGDPNRVTDDSVQRVIDTLIDQGRLAGIQEAKAEEKIATRRLREQADAAKLALEASEGVALEATAQAAEADRIRQQAEARTAAAESLAQKAESERQSQELEASRQLIAARAAREVTAGVLAGRERAWSATARQTGTMVAVVAVIAALILAALIAFAGWLVRQALVTGVIVVVILGTGVLNVINDTVKSRRDRWIASKSESLARVRLKRPIHQFERDLELPVGFVRTDHTGERVSIKNRDEIFEFLEKRAASNVVPDVSA